VIYLLSHYCHDCLCQKKNSRYHNLHLDWYFFYFKSLDHHLAAWEHSDLLTNLSISLTRTRWKPFYFIEVSLQCSLHFYWGICISFHHWILHLLYLDREVSLRPCFKHFRWFYKKNSLFFSICFINSSAYSFFCSASASKLVIISFLFWSVSISRITWDSCSLRYWIISSS